ncbi:nucleoplasmin-like isoform X2 [Hypanus sabinus]|uniref:nucleoplasmin-like isoform X2 n=1 Tax=Hypanus sabinus TaxID=79690 RepID=UPI0028C3E4E3|nr:nucleoplasmin-like isoform X2 [Hypanus sabinus]
MSSHRSKMDKSTAILWSCELNAQQKSHKVEITDDEVAEHRLSLKTICLGAGAKDELTIVEIVPEDESPPVPIATLKLSVLPMTTFYGIELTPPISFRLKSGSGPVYIAVENMINDDTWGEEEEEEGEEEEEEEVDEAEDEDESPPKKTKRPASTKKAGLSKKKRLDTEKEEEESDVLMAVKKEKDSSKVKAAKKLTAC